MTWICPSTGSGRTWGGKTGFGKGINPPDPLRQGGMGWWGFGSRYSLPWVLDLVQDDVDSVLLRRLQRLECFVDPLVGFFGHAHAVVEFQVSYVSSVEGTQGVSEEASVGEYFFPGSGYCAPLVVY